MLKKRTVVISDTQNTSGPELFSAIGLNQFAISCHSSNVTRLRQLLEQHRKTLARTVHPDTSGLTRESFQKIFGASDTLEKLSDKELLALAKQYSEGQGGEVILAKRDLQQAKKELDEAKSQARRNEEAHRQELAHQRERLILEWTQKQGEHEREMKRLRGRLKEAHSTVNHFFDTSNRLHERLAKFRGYGFIGPVETGLKRFSDDFSWIRASLYYVDAKLMVWRTTFERRAGNAKRSFQSLRNSLADGIYKEYDAIHNNKRSRVWHHEGYLLGSVDWNEVEAFKSYEMFFSGLINLEYFSYFVPKFISSQLDPFVESLETGKRLICAYVVQNDKMRQYRLHQIPIGNQYIKTIVPKQQKPSAAKATTKEPKKRMPRRSCRVGT